MLRLEHVVDDGAAFYLNGREIVDWRFNLPAGDITHATPASSGVANATLSAPRDIPAAGLGLVVGLNRLSVEVHQQITTSNDMVCGARLSTVAVVSPAIPPSPVTSNPLEWIELHNKGTSTVNLQGWSLSDAVDFHFPAGSSIPPGGFLVVSNQGAALRESWPDRSSTILGDFSGSLANDGERIELRDARGNPADDVRYLPSLRSDGGGSSLELVDARSDNSQPAAWSESDESGKSSWQTFTWRDQAIQRFGPTTWNELRLGMLDAGECLIDDLRVRRDPDGANVELLQDGGFDLLPPGSKWRFLGNHAASNLIEDAAQPGNRLLHFSATGPTETNHNHAETTFLNNTPLTSEWHEVSFRARWLSGSNQLNVRAYYQKLAKTWELPIPSRLGTPGAANSRSLANAGPVLTDLRHHPAIPAAQSPVTVSFAATDPDGVASATLHHRLNGSSDFSAMPMSLTDGRWTASLPGQSAGAIVHFYATATDGRGATSNLPARGPQARALVQWQDSQSTSLPAHQIRLIMLTSDRTFLLGTFNRLSNDRVPGTLVYRGTEVFHDVGVRLQGTAAGRVRDGDDYIGYDISFPPDHLFRGLHDSIGIDRSARTPAVRRPDEIYVRHTFNSAGLPCTTDDVCFFFAPQSNHSGIAILQMAAYGGLWTDSQFEDVPGTVYNWDITYDPSTTSVASNPESLKPPVPFGHVTTDLVNLGDDKEQYRGPFDIRAGKRRDEYSGLINLAQTMALPSAQLAMEAPRLLDLDQVLRCTALVNLWGIGDTYYTAGLPHNIRLFVPDHGRDINFLPWDMDFTMSGASNAPLIPSGNNLGRLITSSPGHRRLYLGHIRHLCESVFSSAYLSPWLTRFGAVSGLNFSGTSSYVTSRRAFAQTQYPTQIPFAVTTNAGADFSTAEREIVIEGTGWIDIKEVRRQNLPLVLTWTDSTHWRTTLPLTPGSNLISFEAVGFDGDLLATRTLTITSTAPPEPGPAEFLRITELHYHPANPSSPAESAASSTDSDFEFIELRNIGSEAIRLDGVRFVDGIDVAIPAGTTLAGGQFAVVVRQLDAFRARYGPGITVLGSYGPASLVNSGETITLVDATGTIIQTFDYSDSWFPSSDGPGWSLVVRDESASVTPLGHPASWALSPQLHGNPGQSHANHFSAEFAGWQAQFFSPAELADPSLSSPDADPLGTGSSHLLRYAAGLLPNSHSLPSMPSISSIDTSFAIDLRRRKNTLDLDWSLETSTALKQWATEPTAPVLMQDHNDGTETVRWLIPHSSQIPFIRVRVLKR